MASRLELQYKLEKALGSKNVYYQPPAGVKMEYPAIRYQLDDVDLAKADNISYRKTRRYQIIVIDRYPDNPVIDKLLGWPYCSYDRPYTADNLNHDVLILYF